MTKRLFGPDKRDFYGIWYFSSRKIILLNLFIGWLGIHRFCVGKYKSGFLYAISLGFVGFGVAVDMALIAMGDFDDSVSFPSNGEKIFCWFMAILITLMIIVLHVIYA